MKIRTILYFSLFVFLFFSCSKNSKKVPIISNNLILHSKTIDSLKFVNQINKVFPINTLKGKVHIVNFFFTTCKTICPLMEVPLNELAKKHKEVQFISFTIDPQRDNIAVLKDYYQRMNHKNRTFLRGTKTGLTKIASYYLSSINDADYQELYHTSYLVLMDAKMRIRGLYNSLDKDDLLFLENDLSVILKE